MTWESIRSDVSFALRQFRRAPLFACLTIASLALGIGANTAMFAVVNAVLLRPLPYDEPDSLVTIWSNNTKNDERQNPVSPANAEAFRAAPSLAGVEGFYSFLTPAQVVLASDPEPVIVSQVNPGMFTLLGRSPLIGRTFDDPDAPDGALVSYQFWQRRLGGDPNVVGRTMSLTGGGAAAVIPILGVMPEDFTFPYGTMLGRTLGFTRSQVVDMWWPISRERDPRLVDATGAPNRSIHYFGVVGRLHPDATIDRVRADLEAIAAQRASDYPDTNAGWGVTVLPLHEQAVGTIRPALLILLGGVGVVLLITCINVANVLLARAAGRGRDLAVRSALGASRSRLIQQSLVESMVLAVLGGVAGLGVMMLVIRAVLALAPSHLPRIGEVSPDLPVGLFAFTLSVVTGIVVGVIPAATAARSTAQESLRDGARTTASRTRQNARAALIVAEVALAMTLTVAGGLLLRSFVSVLNVDPGFTEEHLLTMQVSVPAQYADTPSRLAFYDRLESTLEALPGVTAVGGTTRLPLGSTNVTTYVEVEGRPAVNRADLPEVEMRRAVFDYFEAMQIPVVRGRSFTRDDHAEAPPAAVINNAFAARLFPNEDPIGRRIRFGSPNQPWMTIIGVVGDIRHGSLEEVPRPEFYITYRQGPPVGPFLVVRTAGDPAALATAVRQAIRELGADPPMDLRTMEAIRSASVGTRRFVLSLVGAFGALSLGLASLGVFGVITLIAAERTTEVGIRLALGATPADVLRLLLSHAARLAAAGILIGTLAAMAISPLVEAQLFGVRRLDPLTYAAVALALLLMSVLAAYIPARRAMSVDPAQALRN
ncbi:MAG TPA: ABC transporter permease [Vicinamibacterales bacterium]